MRYTSQDVGSDMIIDRRRESGVGGWLSNAGRALAARFQAAKPVVPEGPPPLPLPTDESVKGWKSIEETYEGENFYDLIPSEQAEIRQLSQLRQLASNRLR